MKEKFLAQTGNQHLLKQNDIVSAFKAIFNYVFNGKLVVDICVAL